MAQTGYTPILIYSSTTGGQAPAVGNLTNSTLGSELAINITDGKLFYKDNANVVQVIGWKVVPATAGGTGQTSYAVGDILFANTTTSLAKLADVATGNALISGGVGVAPAYGKIGLTTHVSGTLPVANGGTGTATAFTAGSVVFAGASGVYSQDNANFFWDDVNNRLGIGTTSPTGRLEMMTLAGDAEAYGTIYSSNGGNEFAYLLRKSNQNTVGNTATANGDRLGGFQWQGNSGSGFTPAARIRSVQVGAASTQTPAEIKFETSNGTSFTEKLNIAPGGDVTVNVGNLVIGTSGKGIDFSATPGTGTSELLADYEEGTWTPNQGSALVVVGTFSSSGTYTKIGRTVFVTGTLSGSTSVSTSVGDVMTSNLPFTSLNTTSYGMGNMTNNALNASSSTWVNANSTTLFGTVSIAATTNVFFTAVYQTA
jgi:hypothetical protein